MNTSGTVEVTASVEQVDGSDNTWRLPVIQLDGGVSTRSYPHLLPAYMLSIGSNLCASQDGLPSKRPGNGYYGGSASGATGSTLPSLSGTRFVSQVYGAQLLTQSNGLLWKGNDGTGAFTQVAGLGVSSTQRCRYAPVFDQDWTGGGGGSDTLIICDGQNTPRQWDGFHGIQAVTTGAGYLPTQKDGATPIQPAFVVPWGNSLVYAGDKTLPQTIWISDATHPQKFTGIALVDGANVGYFGVQPGGQHTRYGSITGLAVFGQALIVFYQRAVIVGINTGSYGAFQFQWTPISTGIGAVASDSIVEMPQYVIFFGGDGFYATDGNSVVPLPDELPTLYAAVSRSRQPPEIKNPTTLFCCRRGDVYWISYDAGSGHLERIAIFDTSAKGGWQYGSRTGGAWYLWPTGMTLSWGIECRTGSDSATMPFFWGSSVGDRIAQHDIGTFDDFGQPISIEARTKTFFFDKPLAPKTVQSLYLIFICPLLGTTYTLAVTPYAIEDLQEALAPTLTIVVSPNGVAYGLQDYGTFTYSAQNAAGQVNAKTYPQSNGPCAAVSFGFFESSTHPVSILGFVAEVTIDPVI